MPDDSSPELSGGAAERRTTVAVAGHQGDAATVRRALNDPDAQVRASALSALARIGGATVADATRALADPEAVVRRRACEIAAALSGPGSRSNLLTSLRSALGDPEPLVVESACWALGERRDHGSVAALSACAGDHPDTRCREAAVASLGAIGDPSGLPAVLGRLGDKPTVRRRAVVALAAFDGPTVDAALHAALDDRDWQVRQAASALLGQEEPPPAERAVEPDLERDVGGNVR